MTQPSAPFGTRLLTAALAYAARGWFVFPLRPRAKEPLTPTGYLDASTDPAAIAAWWQRWPTANIGLAPGRSDLLILDIDGPVGEASATTLGLLREPTLVCTTGRVDGGRHLYFKHPGFLVSNKDLADKLNVRGDMGYVVLPPSIHPTGVLYRWAGKLNELRALPAAVAAQLKQLQQSSAPSLALTKASDIPSQVQIAEGGRNNMLTAYAGRLFAKGLQPTEVYDLLLALNAQRCVPPLPVQEILGIIRSIGGKEAAKPTRQTETGVTLRAMDATEETEPPPAFTEIARAQVREAVAQGNMDLTGAPRWEWPVLDTVVGPMLPGDLWFIGALMANGKTALLMSQLDAFATAKTPVMYLPLELKPSSVRRRWAAWKLGLDPVAVARNQWERLRPGAREAHEAMMAEQAEGSLIHFPPDRRITLGKLGYWTRAAIDDYGAKIIVVDHFHRMDFGVASANYRVQVTEAVRGLKDLGVLHNIVILASAQLNQIEANPLDRYFPPQLKRLKESAGLGEEADAVLMLSRQLRYYPTAEDLQQIRMGSKSERDFAEPGVMAVTCRKHRIDDAMAGDQTVRLRVEQGRVVNAGPGTDIERSDWTGRLDRGDAWEPEG